MYGYEDCYDEQMYEPTPLDELFIEYNEKCKSILLSSVQSEINSIKDENSKLKEQNKVLNQKLYDIESVKREIEQNKQKYIREGIEEYQREALSGLRCGDTVWVIKTETKKEKCKHCNGTHKIQVDVAGIMKNVDCPHCGYSGETTVSVEYTPVKRKIVQINSSLWAENRRFQRHLYLEDGVAYPREVSDEGYVHDNSDGCLGDAIETNYANGLKRDFWFSEDECLSACKDKKEEWMAKNKTK